jgi:hypothetical protein
VAGESVEVLPLDDARLLEEARPIGPDGKVRIDPAWVEAREEGMMRAALSGGPTAVIVLAGADDLSAPVRRLGTTKAARASLAKPSTRPPERCGNHVKT